MTKAKIRLLTGTIGIIASVALVGGSTLAWFTDTKKVPASKFIAGTVKISAGQKVVDTPGETGKTYYQEIKPASVVDYRQGKQKDGWPVSKARSNPGAVLTRGDPPRESDMFSLGFGGWIIVKLSAPLKKGDVLVVEDTWNGSQNYVETADVSVSDDMGRWVTAGTASNQTNPEGNFHDCTVTCPIANVQYVKLKDTTPRSSASEDGFDIDYVCGRNIVDEVNWNPGDQNKIAFYVNNDGTDDIELRAKLDAQWVDKDGKNTGGLDSGAVQITLPKESGWSLHDDGYYYYNGYLKGTADGKSSCPSRVDLNLNVTLNGDEAGNSYQGATYRVTPTFEAIQYAHNDKWSWDNYEKYNPSSK